MPDTFGDYAPFLEVAFAVNIVAGAWDGIYRRLEASRPSFDDDDRDVVAGVNVDDDSVKVLGEKYLALQFAMYGLVFQQVRRKYGMEPGYSHTLDLMLTFR